MEQLLEAAATLDVPRWRLMAISALVHHTKGEPRLMQRVVEGVCEARSHEEVLAAGLVMLAPWLSDAQLAMPRDASLGMRTTALRRVVVLALDERWSQGVDPRPRMRQLTAAVPHPYNTTVVDLVSACTVDVDAYEPDPAIAALFRAMPAALAASKLDDVLRKLELEFA